MNDPVRAFLQERGCAERVIQGGLPALMEAWEQIVEAIAQGYKLGLDDYLNDMDARQLLAEALALANPAQRQQYQLRLQTSDQRLQAELMPATECIWGDEVARSEGWTRTKNWWYFHYPKKAGEDFISELEGQLPE